MKSCHWKELGSQTDDYLLIMTPAVSPIEINTIKENIRGANTSVRKHKSVTELPPKVKLIESNLEESNPVSDIFSSSNAKKTLDRTTQNLDFDHLSQIPGPSKNGRHRS
ncbi:hypothetical protein JTB14_003453 [Gonioctena quinquepunctata]|nr:hypothetical protein JTB14_003453 [Gonioctena quinquepunctata]